MMEFKSLEELFLRVRPALSYKRSKLKLLGINISEVEIFNKLSDEFKKIEGLTIFDIVDLIMNYDGS